MPKLTKIYTQTGDEGTTSLGSRSRVRKDALRVSAFGDVDELNAALGLVLALGIDDALAEPIKLVQNELFHLGSDLAFPDDETVQFQVPRIERRHVAALEQVIDALNARVGTLENFILPGGTVAAAQLHVARTICRRAERSVVALANAEKVNPSVLQYLNRLSDALFVMSRYENRAKGMKEPLWNSHA
jgi:cob(I)alamin adenosyltransferase